MYGRKVEWHDAKMEARTNRIRNPPVVRRGEDLGCATWYYSPGAGESSDAL